MKCQRCGHDEKEHCKSNIDHSHYHGSWAEAHPKCVIHCTTLHCDNPLCSCVDFIASGRADTLEYFDIRQQIARLAARKTMP